MDTEDIGTQRTGDRVEAEGTGTQKPREQSGQRTQGTQGPRGHRGQSGHRGLREHRGQSGYRSIGTQKAQGTVAQGHSGQCRLLQSHEGSISLEKQTQPSRCLESGRGPSEDNCSCSISCSVEGWLGFFHLPSGPKTKLCQPPILTLMHTHAAPASHASRYPPTVGPAGGLCVCVPCPRALGTLGTKAYAGHHRGGPPVQAPSTPVHVVWGTVGGG